MNINTLVVLNNLPDNESWDSVRGKVGRIVRFPPAYYHVEVPGEDPEYPTCVHEGEFTPVSIRDEETGLVYRPEFYGLDRHGERLYTLYGEPESLWHLARIHFPLSPEIGLEYVTPVVGGKWASLPQIGV